MVKVGEKCKDCKYCSRRTGTCDYRLITGMSRTITNNIRIDPAFCDKYVKGNKEYDAHEWRNNSFKLERLYNQKSIHSRSVLRG